LQLLAVAVRVRSIVGLDVDETGAHGAGGDLAAVGERDDWEGAAGLGRQTRLIDLLEACCSLLVFFVNVGGLGLEFVVFF
jgi:hypothetical protein